MKKLLLVITMLAGFVSAYAQNPDPDSRDKSRYAVNNFENDDLYTPFLFPDSVGGSPTMVCRPYTR